MAKERYFEFVGGGSSKFWSVSQEGDAVTVHFGRIGTNGQTKTKEHGDADEAAAAAAKLIKEKLGEGYVEKAAASAPAKKEAAHATEKKEASDSDDDNDDDEDEDGNNAEDPYAAAHTGKVFHRLKLKGGKGKDDGRATSGGKPILATGQAWPVCGTCKKPQGLLLQFDIAKELELCFKPGSHFLFFCCPTCDETPPVADGDLTKEFLDPDHPQTYRVIVNEPGASEVVEGADARMLLQSPIAFEASPEKLKKGLDCPLGASGVKIGGAPHWTQPPSYKRCSCGAPLGFVLQVPEGGSAGWLSADRKSVTPFLGNDFYIFACSAQCDPYAAIAIPQ